MKQLDWKSLAIGVLLTTTVMFGTGAATSTTEKKVQYLVRGYTALSKNPLVTERVQTSINKLSAEGWKVDKVIETKQQFMTVFFIREIQKTKPTRSTT